MRMPKLRISNSSKSQEGLASIVIVGVLVVLLGLISVGFARIMDRANNQSLNNQLATAATYAAQTALNDVFSHLKNVDPSAEADECSELITPSATNPTPPFQNLSNISGDADRTTSYNCVLINPSPQDLRYDSVNPNRSQVVKMQTTPTADGKLLFSWQSSDSGKTQAPASINRGLLDEVGWNGNNYLPILRLTLYPVPNSGHLDDTQVNSRTYFLYPTSAGGAVTQLDYSVSSPPDGSLQPVSCGSMAPLSASDRSAFGALEFKCNVFVTNLLAGTDYFYARLTPIYSRANIKIKASDSTNNPVIFRGVQSVVDVTAKAGNAAKRLQARVDLSDTTGPNLSSDSDNFPEQALRSAKTLCKRLNVGARTTVNEGQYCDQTLTPTVPTVTLTAEPATINRGETSRLTWDSSFTTSCSAPWTPKTSVDDFQDVAPQDTTIYMITCVGPGGPPATASAEVRVNTGSGGPPGGGGGVPVVVDVNTSPAPAASAGDTTVTWSSSQAGGFIMYCQAFIGGVYYADTSPNGGPFDWAVGGREITFVCYGSLGGSGTDTAPGFSKTPSLVNVRISKPNDLWGVNDYDYTFRTSLRPEAPNDCRDGLHTFVACFDITADYAGNPSEIRECEIRVDGILVVTTPNGPGGVRHWSSQGRWIFYTVGWSNPDPQPDHNLNVTCIAKSNGTRGSDAVNVHWTTCADRGQVGTYGTDVARNGCSDREPPPPPPPPPPPGPDRQIGGDYHDVGGGLFCYFSHWDRDPYDGIVDYERREFSMPCVT